MTTTELAALAGETQEQIDQAQAKRAEAWSRIIVITDLQMTSIGGSCKVWLGKMNPELQLIKKRLAKINSAAWWLRADTSSDERLEWSIINTCRFGMPSGAILPVDFYSVESVASRAAKSAQDAAAAKFLDLPKLKGSEKQAAWAETIRAKFQNYCESCMYSDEFLTVAKRKDAKNAGFWIDKRTESDFEYLLSGVVNAAA